MKTFWEEQEIRLKRHSSLVNLAFSVAILIIGFLCVFISIATFYYPGSSGDAYPIIVIVPMCGVFAMCLAYKRFSRYWKFTLVETMIIVVVILLVIAMFLPPTGKVRASPQDKAVFRNLRLFSFSARQYLLNEGVTVVTFDQIVGPGKPIPTIEQVSDETYIGLTVGTDTTRLETTVNGRAVIYDF